MLPSTAFLISLVLIPQNIDNSYQFKDINFSDYVNLYNHRFDNPKFRLLWISPLNLTLDQRECLQGARLEFILRLP